MERELMLPNYQELTSWVSESDCALWLEFLCISGWCVQCFGAPGGSNDQCSK